MTTPPFTAPQTIEELARQLVLRAPDLDILRPELSDQYSSLATTLEGHFKKREARGNLMLPDLRAHGNQTVAIYSDYAGEGSGRYDTYTFLVCSYDHTGLFAERQRETRAKFKLGSKEIAFKDFRVGGMRSALPEYLRNLEFCVPGLLFTVIIDKRVGSLFHADGKVGRKNLAEQLREHAFGDWKSDVAEKLLRIVETAGFLVGLLAHEGQKIFWMSDHDAICPNENVHHQTLRLFQNAISLFSTKNHPVIGGGTPFQERDLQHLDLLSAADVTASTIAHYMSRKDAAAGGSFDVKPGSEAVLTWLGHEGLSLKKSTVIIRPGGDGMIEDATIQFLPTVIPEDLKIVPIPLPRSRGKGSKR